MAEPCDTECYLYWLSIILSVTYELFMLSVVTHIVVVLTVMAPHVKLINLNLWNVLLIIITFAILYTLAWTDIIETIYSPFCKLVRFLIVNILFTFY